MQVGFIEWGITDLLLIEELRMDGVMQVMFQQCNEAQGIFKN